MENNKPTENQSFNINRENLVKSLIKKLENGKCPMCGQQKFTLVEGYFTHTIQEDLNNVRLGGKAIPTINLICNNCGFVSMHAVGIFQAINGEKQNK